MEDNVKMPQSGEFVTVGCKLPHGLWLEVAVPGKPVTRILAKGCNSSEVIGGFGITPEVPKNFWETWLADHQEMRYVQNEQIWAYKNSGGARAKALEMAKLKHGLEGLDVSKEALAQVGLEKAEMK